MLGVHLSEEREELDIDQVKYLFTGRYINVLYKLDINPWFIEKPHLADIRFSALPRSMLYAIIAHYEEVRYGF